MSYENPRDRFELRLKEIVDDTTPAADRRTRFESFLTGIVTSGYIRSDDNATGSAVGGVFGKMKGGRPDNP